MAQVKIEITFDPSVETLSHALNALRGEEQSVYVQMAIPEVFKKPETKTAPVEPIPEAPAAELVPETPVEEPKKPTVSKADIRALAVALSKSNKAKLKEILESFSAAKLSDVHEDQYAELLEKLEAANA